jgi:hypothetical protein
MILPFLCLSVPSLQMAYDGASVNACWKAEWKVNKTCRECCIVEGLIPPGEVKDIAASQSSWQVSSPLGSLLTKYLLQEVFGDHPVIGHLYHWVTLHHLKSSFVFNCLHGCHCLCLKNVALWQQEISLFYLPPCARAWNWCRPYVPIFTKW